MCFLILFTCLLTNIGWGNPRFMGGSRLACYAIAEFVFFCVLLLFYSAFFTLVLSPLLFYLFVSLFFFLFCYCCFLYLFVFSSLLFCMFVSLPFLVCYCYFLYFLLLFYLLFLLCLFPSSILCMYIYTCE